MLLNGKKAKKAGKQHFFSKTRIYSGSVGFADATRQVRRGASGVPNPGNMRRRGPGPGEA